jgi:signal transduction histidine kinase
MSSKLALAEERFRRKMAIDIHDNLGQDLAMAKMKIEDIAASDGKFSKELDEVSQLLANTIKSTRSLTFELSPPILYELGFEAALKWLVRQANDQYPFSAKFSNDDLPKPLDNDVRIILFQAVKEVLFNVAKHAKAQKVSVSAQRKDHQIQVKIKDDGTGFDVTQTIANEQGKSGYGLFSVRERMDYIGGRILINSKPNEGTHITLFAPLQNENNQVDEKFTNEHKNSIG